jgi:hypothetical protein
MLSRRYRAALAVVVTAVTALTLAASALAAPTVTPPRASLTALWWRAYVSIPSSEDPAHRCDLGIDKVVFLGATTGEDPVTRVCTLSARTSILVPLINIECSSLEAPPFFGATPAERRACAKGFADDFRPELLTLTINGVAVGDLGRLRVQSPPFAFSPVADNMFVIPPGTGGSVSDGYWALIGPLAPGSYEITVGGSYWPLDEPEPLFSTRVTYQLTVV